MYWVVLAAAAALAGQAEFLVPDPGESHRRWIHDLGDDRPEVRDGAAARLRAAGRAAWPALERAALHHDDAEARLRARDLLDRSRLRRGLPYRVLDEHPSAPETLAAGATPEKIRLIRTLARHFEECGDLLHDLVRDPNPEIALAAAESLHENRNFEWSGRLLDLFAGEDCPRAGRVHDLLSSASSRLNAVDLQRRFADAGPRGRLRMLQLTLHTGLPLAVPADEIRDMLRDEDDPVRRRAALAWTRDRDAAAAADDIVRLLDAPDGSLVADALATLRQLRRRPAPARLDALLAHEHAGVRGEAALAVQLFEERACLPALRALLHDSSTAVRQTALRSLWKVEGPRALEDVFAAYLRDGGEPREQAFGFLVTHRDWSLPRARELVRDRDPDRRRRGSELLWRLEGPAILSALARDPDEGVRRWSLDQLARAEFAGAIEGVELFAADASEAVRLQALRALVHRGRREHLPALRTFLGSPEYSIRHDATDTLLDVADAPAEELARKLLEEPDAPFRRLALGALARRGDRGAADAAFASLQDPDGRLRRTAECYLRQALQPQADPALLARLAALLGTAEGETLALAFTLVVKQGDRSAAPALRELLLSGRAPGAEPAVRALALWAGDRAPAELAGLLGADAALNDLAFSQVRDLRRRAPGIALEPLHEPVRALLADPDRRVRRSAAAAAEDLGLIAALSARIADPDPSVRHTAIAACARAGHAAAADAIAARLDEDDPDLRVAALAALLRLKPDSAAALAEAAAHEDCSWAKRRMEFALKGGGR